MKQDNGKTIIYILLSLAIIALIIFGVLRLGQKQNTENNSISETIQRLTSGSGQTSSDQKNETERPLICMRELAAFHNSLEKTGAKGGIMFESYDAGKDICKFNVRSMTKPGNFGTIETLHNLGDGKYGIRLEIDKSDDEQVVLWTKAALNFFNKNINESDAAKAGAAMLEFGSMSSELFTIRGRASVRIDGDKIIPMEIIEVQTP